MAATDASQQGSFTVKIPPLSTTLVEVTQLRGRSGDEVDVGRLVALVERDAATSAHVLKVVNSAYAGLRREASQIDRAVALLGAQSVYNIVMSMGVRETFAQLEVAETRGIYEQVMATSVAAAALARHLALHLGSQLPETTYAAGLLHQIGRLILLFNAPVAYPDLWYRPTDPSPRPKAPTTAEEKARFDSDYTEIGARVAAKWQLPKLINAAIEHHRRPEEVQGHASRSLVLTVAAAHRAATSMYGGRRGQESTFFGLSAPLSMLAREHGVSPRELVGVLVERREEVRQYAGAILKKV